MGIKDSLKRRFEEFRRENAARRARDFEVRKIEQEAHFLARKKEAVKFGRQRAVIEQERRVKALRTPAGSSFGGVFGGYAGFNALEGAGFSGGAVRRKSKKKSKKTRVVGGLGF